MFATLSDRLADTFKNLRGKGRLSEADIDATAREIRIALLEADVALPVVKEFVGAVKERAEVALTKFQVGHNRGRAGDGEEDTENGKGHLPPGELEKTDGDG